jgi:hypothetical protein
VSVDKSRRLKPEHVTAAALAAACVLGVVVRMLWMVRSRGTNDIATWQHWGEYVETLGVRRCYESIAGFNHPPLMGYLAMLVRRLALATHVRFELLFKMVALAGDALAAALLVRAHRDDLGRAARVVTLYAVSLASVLVTGYHGNTDPLCAGLVLLAAVMLDEQRPLAAGLAYAGALNVKLIPLLIGPALVLQLRRPRDLVRFALGASAAILPYLPFLITVPRAFYRAAVAYNSSPNYWGIYGFLLLAGHGGRIAPPAAALAPRFWDHGRWFVLVGVVLVAVLARLRGRADARTGCLAALSAFLVLTPGFGVQYLVYVVPLWFAVEVRRAFVYSTVAGLFMLIIYYDFWTGEVPYYSLFNRHYPLAAAWIGAIVWALLAASAARLLWRGAQRQD